MGAAVRIEDGAFSDGRFDVLARLLGLADADHARGKMARVWRQCTIERRYALSQIDVQALLGENGIEALVSARLGVVRNDGSVRICGTRGRIEWLDDLRKGGKKGGKSRAANAKRDERGRLTSSRLGLDEASDPPPGLPSAPAPTPTPTPVQKREREIAREGDGDRVTLGQFSEAIANAGIAISLGRADQERFSRLFPVERFELDHALDCAREAKAKRASYVLQVIEGDRQKAEDESRGPRPPKARRRESVSAGIARACEAFINEPLPERST